jgi:hypothetical protein
MFEEERYYPVQSKGWPISLLDVGMWLSSRSQKTFFTHGKYQIA